MCVDLCLCVNTASKAFILLQSTLILFLSHSSTVSSDLCRSKISRDHYGAWTPQNKQINKQDMPEEMIIIYS